MATDSFQNIEKAKQVNKKDNKTLKEKVRWKQIYTIGKKLQLKLVLQKTKQKFTKHITLSRKKNKSIIFSTKLEI